MGFANRLSFFRHLLQLLYGICESSFFFSASPAAFALSTFLFRHASCNFLAVSSIKLCVNSPFFWFLCLTTLSHRILVLIRFSYCIFGGNFLNVRFAISYS